MRVLIGCEESGVVRDAFIRGGHDAMSCDLLPSRVPGPHYIGDVFDVIDYPWDLAILHPPCTHTSVSGARHFAAKWSDGRQACGVAFFMALVRRSAHIPRVALEHPISILSTMYRQPDQVIHPYDFGHDASKATCLWLRGLPMLRPTASRVPPRLVCCGRVLETNDVFGCPNCLGEKKAAPRWANQCDSGQNKLTPSDLRARERSETFAGIAEAMAAQWGALQREAA